MFAPQWSHQSLLYANCSLCGGCVIRNHFLLGDGWPLTKMTIFGTRMMTIIQSRMVGVNVRVFPRLDFIISIIIITTISDDHHPHHHHHHLVGFYVWVFPGLDFHLGSLFSSQRSSEEPPLLFFGNNQTFLHLSNQAAFLHPTSRKRNPFLKMSNLPIFNFPPHHIHI